MMRKFFRRREGRATPPPVDRLVRWVEEVVWKPEDGWVLFRNGTGVFTKYLPAGDVEEQAREYLRRHGKVVPGTPAGDFSVYEAVPGGWLVTGDADGIFVYVHPTETTARDDLAVGLLGRAKRDIDWHTLEVVHVKHAAA